MRRSISRFALTTGLALTLFVSLFGGSLRPQDAAAGGDLRDWQANYGVGAAVDPVQVIVSPR